MKTLKIIWRKDLKNSVPFYIFVNGKECGILERGKSQEVDVYDENVEVYLVPKAPKFFGWKALKTDIRIIGDNPEIHFSVKAQNTNSILEGNQMHVYAYAGLEIKKSETVKRY